MTKAAAKTSERVLSMGGVFNFRDYGGYPVVQGGRLKRGVLWRSSQHTTANDDDLRRIAELGLVSVFDLRSHAERQKQPCRRPEGFAATVYTIEDVPNVDNDPSTLAEPLDKDLAPHEAVAVATGGAGHPGASPKDGPRRDPATTRQMMMQAYTKIPFRSGQLSLMRRYFAVLARGEGASLINCMAGKDRTGIAVALLHRALGVHHDDLMEDYLMTNTAGNQEARIAAGGMSVSAIMGPLQMDVLKVLMGVAPEYLETAFSEMRRLYGSEEAYMAKELGVDAAMRDRLRAHMVE